MPGRWEQQNSIMVESKHKAKVFLGKLVLIIIGLLLLLFALYQINAFINGDVEANFGKAMMLSLVAVSLVYAGIDSIKSISVDTISGELKISYLGIYEQKLTRYEILGYQIMPIFNRSGIISRILIELKSGQQYQFTERDFHNYKDLDYAISGISFHRGDIELRYLTPATKMLIGYFCTVIAIVVLYEIYK